MLIFFATRAPCSVLSALLLLGWVASTDYLPLATCALRSLMVFFDMNFHFCYHALTANLPACPRSGSGIAPSGRIMRDGKPSWRLTSRRRWPWVSRSTSFARSTESSSPSCGRMKMIPGTTKTAGSFSRAARASLGSASPARNGTTSKT